MSPGGSRIERKGLPASGLSGAGFIGPCGPIAEGILPGFRAGFPKPPSPLLLLPHPALRILCRRQPIARHVTNRPRGWEPGSRGAGGASNATPGAATTLAIGIGYRHVSAEGALPLEVW